MARFSEEQFATAKIHLQRAYEAATVGSAVGDPDGLNASCMERALRKACAAVDVAVLPCRVPVAVIDGSAVRSRGRPEESSTIRYLRAE